MIENDTIAAVASGVGGAVTLIRVSGGGAIAAGDRIFRGVRGRRLADARGFTILYGTIRDGETVVDEVLVSVFRAPHSYTGEDMIERAGEQLAALFSPTFSPINEVQKTPMADIMRELQELRAAVLKAV